MDRVERGCGVGWGQGTMNEPETHILAYIGIIDMTAWSGRDDGRMNKTKQNRI